MLHVHAYTIADSTQIWESVVKKIDHNTLVRADSSYTKLLSGRLFKNEV